MKHTYRCCVLQQKDEMNRWLQHEALCIIGGRWWRKEVDEIIAELTNNSDIIASHLVIEADCALCHALVAKARAAAVASASTGEEAPSDPEEEHRNCSAPGVCAAENLSLRKQMHVRTHV